MQGQGERREGEMKERVEQVRRSQVKESSQPTGHRPQLDSNSTCSFPQPKFSHRTDFNCKSPIQDPRRIYTNPKEKLKSLRIKK